MYIVLAIAIKIIEAFSIVLAIYCIASWFIHDPFNKFMIILSTIVDPVLEPVRAILKRIPFLANLPIDFSPLILFLLIEFVLSLL